MAEKSLKNLKLEKDKNIKEVDQTVKKFEATEKDIKETADKLGNIKTTLSDVRVRVNDAKNRVFKSAEKAAGQDSSAVETKEKVTQKHQTEVDAINRQTEDEKRKADNVKPKDRRIEDGREISKVLGQTSSDLKEISKKEQDARVKAEANRKQLNAKVTASIARNRK